MVIIWNVAGFWKFIKGKPTASLPWRLWDRSVVSNFPPAGHTLRGFLAWSKQVKIISILNRWLFFLLAIIYPLAYPTTNQYFRSGKSRWSERYESDDGLQFFSLNLGGAAINNGRGCGVPLISTPHLPTFQANFCQVSKWIFQNQGGTLGTACVIDSQCWYNRNALQHSFLANAPLIPPPTCGGEKSLSGNFKVVKETFKTRMSTE